MLLSLHNQPAVHMLHLIKDADEIQTINSCSHSFKLFKKFVYALAVGASLYRLSLILFPYSSFLSVSIQSWNMDYYTANGVGGWEPSICRIIATSMTFGQNKKWSFFCKYVKNSCRKHEKIVIFCGYFSLSSV